MAFSLGLILVVVAGAELFTGNNLLVMAWDRLQYAAGLRRSDGSRVTGTVLMQLLGDRRLKVEVFMGKLASQVTGFTNAAVVYER